MHEGNKTLVVEKTNELSQPFPAQPQASSVLKRPRKASVSANLSAGMLDNNRMKRPKGILDFVVSIAGHALIVATAILVPLYFSNAIDIHQLQLTYLVAPPLPPPPPPAAEAIHAIRHPRSFFADNKLYAPRVIPKRVAEVKDLRPASQTTAGVPGGIIGGVPGGQLSGVIGGILRESAYVPRPPAPRPKPHLGPYRVGGNIQRPQLIRQVVPTYPILAKETRVQGTVVIDSIIDTHGNVTEMKLVSGNPLLVTATFNAVRQWQYEPTLLNGIPVPIEMLVTVHFSLGS
jgi:periplasmic protein TonB